MVRRLGYKNIPVEMSDVVVSCISRFRRGATVEVVASETGLEEKSATEALRALKRERRVCGPNREGKFFPSGC